MPVSNKKELNVTIKPLPRTDSSDSTTSSVPSIKTPRTARFAEATAVHSPIEPSKTSRSPFADPPTNHYMPQPQPSDVGFGYLSANDGPRQVGHSVVEIEETDKKYMPPMSPLKSALKSPGAPPRKFDNPLSPTFREEQILEKQEENTDKEQAKDLKVKVRVRLAKMILRGINFSCSLIVVSMLAAVFAIFNATKHLPPRNNLPPWAANTRTWPQITLLVIACVSLLMSIVIFYAYWRGGHRRAEKVAVYYTSFAVVFFVFSIIMWGIGAGILNQSKTQGNGQDMWGWACKDNKRRMLFEDDVAYALSCRLQDWALVCCIIEIVVETLTIAIYGVVFYRYWTKRKLRKSMAVRDRARSDLYLAQLRCQSAPNTPGFGPLSPRDGGWRPPPGHPSYIDPHSAAENGAADVKSSVDDDNVQYPRGFAQPKPFTLQPPPIKVTNATPKLSQSGFSTPSAPAPPSPDPAAPPMSPGFFVAPEVQQEHVPAAPGETQYAAVPIPGAYASPVASPTFAPAHLSFQQPRQEGLSGFDFGPAVNRS